MITVNNEPIYTFKKLAVILSKNSITSLLFSDLSAAVELLFKCSFKHPLNEENAIYILSEWQHLNKNAPSKVPYFKRYLINVADRFSIEVYTKWKSYPRAQPYSIEFVMARDCCDESTAENTIKVLKNKTSGSLETYIQRYGETEGVERFNSFSKKSAHTLQTFQEHYGTTEGVKKYAEYINTKDSGSLAYFNKKYGEKGKELYEQHCKLVGYYNTIEYYIQKYGSEEGYTKYKERSMSKGKKSTYFIEKYGEEYWQNLYTIKLKTLGYSENFETLTGFDIYRKRVHRLSNQQPIYKLKNASKRGHLKNTVEAYNLDHKYSIYQCYVDSIPEHIASHITNLEFIPMQDNINKGVNCSITKQELLEGYHNYENNKNHTKQ